MDGKIVDESSHLKVMAQAVIDAVEAGASALQMLADPEFDVSGMPAISKLVLYAHIENLDALRDKRNKDDREVLKQWRQLAWPDRAQNPPRPDVAIKKAGSIEFVSMYEIDSPIRESFDRVLYGSACPSVEGEPHGSCAFCSDWLHYLSGRRSLLVLGI